MTQFLNYTKDLVVCDPTLFTNLYVPAVVLTIQDKLRDISEPLTIWKQTKSTSSIETSTRPCYYKSYIDC